MFHVEIVSEIKVEYRIYVFLKVTKPDSCENLALET